MNSNPNCRWPQCSCHDGPKLPCLYEKPGVHVELARAAALASVGMDPKRPLDERLAAAKANVESIRREMAREAKRAAAAGTERILAAFRPRADHRANGGVNHDGRDRAFHPDPS